MRGECVRRVSTDTCVRVREEVQSGSTKVVAFHKGHIYHNSPRPSPPGEGIKINPQQPHLAQSGRAGRPFLLERPPFSGTEYVNIFRS